MSPIGFPERREQMFRDAVGWERYLRAGREVFHDIATALPLFCPYSDDEGDLHFIRMAYLVADAFSREVDRDRHVFPPQVLRELYRVPARLGLDNGDHKLRRRRVARQKVVRFQKIARGYVRLEIPELLAAVQKAREVGTHLIRNVRRAIYRVEDAPVGDADLKIVLIGAETAQDPVRDRDYLGVGFHARDAYQIRIELPVLADAALLRALVAEHICYGVPTGGERYLPRASRDHARQGRRHFRTQCHFAVPTVGKGIRLLVHDLFRGLAFVELRRFQDRTPVFLVAEQLANALHVFEQIALEELLFGVEIPYALVWFRRQFFGRHIKCHCIPILSAGKVHHADNSTMNSAPLPSPSDSARIVPPCASTTVFATKRP